MVRVKLCKYDFEDYPFKTPLQKRIQRNTWVLSSYFFKRRATDILCWHKHPPEPEVVVEGSLWVLFERTGLGAGTGCSCRFCSLLIIHACWAFEGGPSWESQPSHLSSTWTHQHQGQKGLACHAPLLTQLAKPLWPWGGPCFKLYIHTD